MSQLRGECRIIDLQATSFDQVLSDAAKIAEGTGRREASHQVIASLVDRVSRIRAESARFSGRRPVVMLLEWIDPLFCAGHWTPQLIEWAGGDDPIGRSGEPSRVISQRDLFSADPDILLVACCGMSADRTRQELSTLAQTPSWSDLRCVRAGQVHTFDGSVYFNRPGPRLVDALESVARLVDQWRACQ